MENMENIAPSSLNKLNRFFLGNSNGGTRGNHGRGSVSVPACSPELNLKEFSDVQLSFPDEEPFPPNPVLGSSSSTSFPAEALNNSSKVIDDMTQLRLETQQLRNRHDEDQFRLREMRQKLRGAEQKAQIQRQEANQAQLKLQRQLAEATRKFNMVVVKEKQYLNLQRRSEQEKTRLKEKLNELTKLKQTCCAKQSKKKGHAHISVFAPENISMVRTNSAYAVHAEAKQSEAGGSATATSVPVALPNRALEKPTRAKWSKRTQAHPLKIRKITQPVHAPPTSLKCCATADKQHTHFKYCVSAEFVQSGTPLTSGSARRRVQNRKKTAELIRNMYPDSRSLEGMSQDPKVLADSLHAQQRVVLKLHKENQQLRAMLGRMLGSHGAENSVLEDVNTAEAPVPERDDDIKRTPARQEVTSFSAASGPINYAVVDVTLLERMVEKVLAKPFASPVQDTY